MADVLNALVLLANFVIVPALAYGSQLSLVATVLVFRVPGKFTRPLKISKVEAHLAWRVAARGGPFMPTSLSSMPDVACRRPSMPAKTA